MKKDRKDQFLSTASPNFRRKLSFNGSYVPSIATKGVREGNSKGEFDVRLLFRVSILNSFLKLRKNYE